MLFDKFTEVYIKVLLWAAYLLMEWVLLSAYWGRRGPVVGGMGWKLYLLGLAGVELFVDVVHPSPWLGFQGGQKLPFLPLMLTSSYCALGLLVLWVQLSCHLLRSSSHKELEKEMVITTKKIM